MITEDDYIFYLKNLATAHKLIEHDVDGKKAFFEIEDPEELSNFDASLRNATCNTAMLVVSAEGELDDNGSENHEQGLDLQVYILQRKKTGVNVSDIRSECIVILKDILGRVKSDARHGLIMPGKTIRFRISNIPVKKVGPMKLDWYGYTAFLRFTCPFGYTVDSGTWTDI